MTELPRGWRWTNLDEVCSKPQYGWTTKATLDGAGLKLLRTSDITSGAIDWARVPRCTKDPDDPAKYLLAPNDIVVSRAGSVGVSALITHCEKAVFASYLIRFRVKPGADHRYIAWFLQSAAYWEQIADSTSGIAIPNVNATKLGSVRLPLPSLDEQRLIVQALDGQIGRIGLAVGDIQRAVARTNALERSILLNAIHQASASSVGSVRLDKIAEVRLGRQRSPKNHSGEHMKPYLRAANVGWIGLLLEDVKQMNFAPDEQDAYRLRPGDILLSEASGSPNEVGKPAIWLGELAECYFQNTLLRVRVTRPDVEPRYLLAVFRLLALTGGFARASRGVGIHHLGAQALAAWELPLPPVDDQRRLVAHLDKALLGVARLRNDLHLTLARATKLRNAMLNAAFTGRLTLGAEAGQTRAMATEQLAWAVT